MVKKQFAEAICKVLNLKSITPSCFVFATNCILIGFVLVKIPTRKAYKLYFSIFPLWRATFKECLDMPMYQQAIINDKNMDIYLPLDMSDDEISFAINQCFAQIPFVPAKDIKSAELIKFLNDKTVSDHCVSGNFVLKMKTYQLIYNIALMSDDFSSAANVYKQISQDINKWNNEIFQYWFGDKKSYLKHMLDYGLNKLNLQENIQNNLSNPKMFKLPKFNLLNNPI